MGMISNNSMAKLDHYAANLRLETLGIKIDHLTKEQESYLNS
jgi:S-adenosylhomocysteine hydrolase